MAEFERCTCSKETRNAVSEFTGQKNVYYEPGCPIHDELAFRAKMLELLDFLEKENL